MSPQNSACRRFLDVITLPTAPMMYPNMNPPMSMHSVHTTRSMSVLGTMSPYPIVVAVITLQYNAIIYRVPWCTSSRGLFTFGYALCIQLPSTSSMDWVRLKKHAIQ